jgi:threonine dehydratase
LEDYTEDPRVDMSSSQVSSSASLSTSSSNQYAFDENGDASSEFVSFPAVDRNSKDYNMETKPVLLNAKEHAIGYLSKILNARVYEAAIETDLQHAKNLSAVRTICIILLADLTVSKTHIFPSFFLSLQHLKNTVLLKREDTQPVFSFKVRGAYNKMAHLTQADLERGVVACSAGNHAQGVAMSARMLGCRAVIVMPLATPLIKVNAVRTHGGPTVEVRLFGNNYDEAAAEAYRLMKEESMAMIHPFDDPYVIAGQGTIGELKRGSK